MKSLQGAVKQKWALGLSVLLLALLCHKAEAQSSLFSESIVGLNNIGDQMNFLDFSYGPDNSTATQSFTGMHGLGNTQTQTFSGTTISQSDYGRLHVYTTGSLTNSYYNASNSPYADVNGNVNDPTGSPSTVNSLGFAVFNDTLQHGGALQNGYKAIYIFHVDGTNSGVGAAVDLVVNVDNNPGEGCFDFDFGFLSTDWITQGYDVNGITPQHINVQFSDQVVFDTFNLIDGQSYTGTSDSPLP